MILCISIWKCRTYKYIMYSELLRILYHYYTNMLVCACNEMRWKPYSARWHCEYGSARASTMGAYMGSTPNGGAQNSQHSSNSIWICVWLNGCSLSAFLFVDWFFSLSLSLSLQIGFLHLTVLFTIPTLSARKKYTRAGHIYTLHTYTHTHIARTKIK